MELSVGNLKYFSIVICFLTMLFRICRRYDEMSDRVNEMPEETEALVQLQEYMTQVNNGTGRSLN